MRDAGISIIRIPTGVAPDFRLRVLFGFRVKDLGLGLGFRV